MRSAPVLSVVVPCYNEQDVLPITLPAIASELEELERTGAIAPGSRVLAVDDGSADDTWAVVSVLARSCPRVTGIRLSRNRGQQNALVAGLMESRGSCDAVISIDCDGQDDISAMGEMVARYRDGYDVVYGVRANRDADGWFKRTSARAYYRLLAWLGADVVYDHADYRLISAPVLEELSAFKEINVYLRGLLPLVGFKSCEVAYDRAPRAAGRSSYSLGRMLALTLDGITSLSIRPLRMIVALGAVISVASFAGIVWAVATALLGNAVSGWASMICVVLLLGGFELVCLGVIGEYVGKTYLEAKGRPRYIVAERTGGPAPAGGDPDRASEGDSRL